MHACRDRTNPQPSLALLSVALRSSPVWMAFKFAVFIAEFTVQDTTFRSAAPSVSLLPLQTSLVRSTCVGTSLGPRERRAREPLSECQNRTMERFSLVNSCSWAPSSALMGAVKEPQNTRETAPLALDRGHVTLQRSCGQPTVIPAQNASERFCEERDSVIECGGYSCPH